VTDKPLTKNTNMQTFSLMVDKVPMFLKKLLCRYARYYNGQMYDFVLDGENELKLALSPGQRKSNKLLIVARAFYQEQAKEYPIENKSELKKLLALEFGENIQCCYHIWDREYNNSCKVNIWNFNVDLPNAFITLPESLLYALSVPNEQSIEVQGTKDNCALYVDRMDNVVHSALATAMINSSQRFAMSVGLTASQKVIQVNENNIAQQLAQGIKQVSLPIISSFIKKPKIENRLQLITNIAFPIVTVLSLYLVVSSLYLQVKHSNLQQQLLSHSDGVTAALARQTKVDQEQVRYLALQELLTPMQAKSPLWLVLADLFPQAKFTNVRLENNRFILRGSTEKAIVFLELLSKHSQVSNAKFDFPTRKSRKRDFFVISFTLLPALEDELRVIGDIVSDQTMKKSKSNLASTNKHSNRDEKNNHGRA